MNELSTIETVLAIIGMLIALVCVPVSLYLAAKYPYDVVGRGLNGTVEKQNKKD